MISKNKGHDADAESNDWGQEKHRAHFPAQILGYQRGKDKTGERVDNARDMNREADEYAEPN